MDEEKKQTEEETLIEEAPKFPVSWGWVIFFGILISLAIFCSIMILTH